MSETVQTPAPKDANGNGMFMYPVPNNKAGSAPANSVPGASGGIAGPGTEPLNKQSPSKQQLEKMVQGGPTESVSPESTGKETTGVQSTAADQSAEAESTDAGQEKKRTYLGTVEWLSTGEGVRVSDLVTSESRDAPITVDQEGTGERVSGFLMGINQERAAEHSIHQNFAHEGEIFIAVSADEQEWVGKQVMSFEEMRGMIEKSGISALMGRGSEIFAQRFSDPSERTAAESCFNRVALLMVLAEYGSRTDEALAAYGSAMSNSECTVYGKDVDWESLWERARSAELSAGGTGEVGKGGVSAEGQSGASVEQRRTAIDQKLSDLQGRVLELKKDAPEAKKQQADNVLEQVRELMDRLDSSATGSTSLPQSSEVQADGAPASGGAPIAESGSAITEAEPDPRVTTQEFVVGNIQINGITSPGNPNIEENEYGGKNYDDMLMFETTIGGEKVAVAVAMDGVSDNRTGVDLAKQNLQSIVERLVQEGISDPGDIMTQALTQLDGQISGKNLGQFTVAFAVVGKNWYVTGKAGDAQPYVMGPEGYYRPLLNSPQYIDHPTWDQLGPDEQAGLRAEGHDGSVPLNVIDNAVGGGELRVYLLPSQQFLPGARILLTTDGVGVPYDEHNKPRNNLLTRMHRPTPAQIANLVAQKGNDNIAAIEIKNSG